jgi:hypothetical protein
MMFYRKIEPLTEGVPVQYLGVYILKWGQMDAEVGFVEAEDKDIVKYLQEQGYTVSSPPPTEEVE